VLYADDPKREQFTVDASGASKLIIDCDFAAGSVTIQPKDMAQVVTADVYYTPQSVRYEHSYENKNGTGYLLLESTHRNRNGNYDSDETENEWDVTLSEKYPMELNMEMGACEANFDLGGLPITALDMEFGAVSGVIDFSRPNPQRMEDLVINAGATSLDLRNIGNANFQRMRYEGGASSVELDLRGTYTGESEIDISVGMGSADIFLPADVAVRIESDRDNWFSSVDFYNEDLEKAGRDAYQSPGFDTAKNRIVMRIDVGMGSVDVRWR